VVSICKALGLDFSKTYEQGLEEQGLRYGKVMIMCDQDTDGSHIKGLGIVLVCCSHAWMDKLMLYDPADSLSVVVVPIIKK